jgi:limonene-1,2-epoxide hydrolase
MGPSEIVLGFLQACARGELDTALRTLTEDVEYDNVPIGKVTGREAVRGCSPAASPRPRTRSTG